MGIEFKTPTGVFFSSRGKPLHLQAVQQLEMMEREDKY